VEQRHHRAYLIPGCEEIADTVTLMAAGREPSWEGGSIFDVLERQLADRPADGGEKLPFDLADGYVGYLGYERPFSSR
jgi:hypothetical protein